MTFDERIRAIHVIQRFVRMSRTLLPLFSDLLHQERLSESDQRKITRIRDVYDNFKVDPDVSRQLINSDILELIQNSYRWLIGHKDQSPENCSDYSAFIEESERLMRNWEVAQSN